jgi:hypothetical protein
MSSPVFSSPAIQGSSSLPPARDHAIFQGHTYIFSQIRTQFGCFCNTAIGLIASRFFRGDKSPCAKTEEAHLHPTDHAYNLIHLSRIDPLNILPFICTEEIRRSIPTLNPISSGHENALQLQNELGDDLLAGLSAAASLTLLLASCASLIRCVADSAVEPAVAADFCFAKQGEEWFSSSPLFYLSLGSLLLSAFYAHHQGWLGKWRHDPFYTQRAKKTEELFKNIALELHTQRQQATQNKEMLEKLTAAALGLSQQLPTIRHALVEQLQLTPSDALKAVHFLEWASTAQPHIEGMTDEETDHSPPAKINLRELAWNILLILFPSPPIIALGIYYMGKKLWTR